jgi:hypothetical protein
MRSQPASQPALSLGVLALPLRGVPPLIVSPYDSGALPKHPRNLLLSKSYTRAGLQGIVNCSCSANLHKSILNQLSGPRERRVRARGVSQPANAPAYAQVRGAARRVSAPRRRAPARRCGVDYIHGVSRGEPRACGKNVPTHRVRARAHACVGTCVRACVRARVCTGANKVSPDGISNRPRGRKSSAE